ncbi:MAG: beta-propeller fold lactonase family protein, partial [Methylosarcina sp.]
MKISRITALMLVLILDGTSIAAAATKTFAYVVNNTVPGSVTVVDAANNTVLKTLPLGGAHPTRLSA